MAAATALLRTLRASGVLPKKHDSREGLRTWRPGSRRATAAGPLPKGLGLLLLELGQATWEGLLLLGSGN
jgi:hypothetical protein